MNRTKDLVEENGKRAYILTVSSGGLGMMVAVVPEEATKEFIEDTYVAMEKKLRTSKISIFNKIAAFIFKLSIAFGVAWFLASLF